MYLINKLRNFINISPTARKFFVSLLSPFTVPLLFLQNYLSVKGYKRRKRISLWKKTNPKNILHYKNGTAFNISINKSSVSKSLVFQNDYEFNETSLVKQLIKPGSIVIDIGSNFGWYSIIFSQLVGVSGKIFSFEPVPETYEELNSNVKLNSCKNIKTFNLALGNEEGSVNFGVPEFDGSSGASSQFLKCKKQIQVAMRKLDEIIEEQNITNINFIKADIEDGELNMLHGSEKILNKFKPDIMIEIVDMHCDRFGYAPIDVYQFLLSKGYNGLFIGNEYTKEKTDIKINDLIKPNVKNLLNGNYFFRSV
jgi:FkbM family methyltransferase